MEIFPKLGPSVPGNFGCVKHKKLKNEEKEREKKEEKKKGNGEKLGNNQHVRYKKSKLPLKIIRISYRRLCTNNEQCCGSNHISVEIFEIS